MPRRQALRSRRRRRVAAGIGNGESQSLTGRFIESLTTGFPVASVPAREIPGAENDLMRMGDPDVNPLQNEYAGDEAPGATTPTPDQNVIDDIGRAYGIQDTETGALRTSSEILDRRDGFRPAAGSRRSL